MKVLLFTHSQDIDGMGCAVLARKAFGDYTLVPTKTFEITKNVENYIKSKKIYDFDKIYVTDLCIKEPVLKFIDNDEILKNRLLVLDHHKTEIEEGNNKYDFVNIIVQKNGRKESGTSLFYNYLIQNNYLQRSNILDELVEWTRQYDVWDWESKNNINARNLHVLFEVLGYDAYLKIINDKVDKLNSIVFNNYEKEVIDKFNKEMEKDILNILNDMKCVDLSIDGNSFKVGFVKCPYKYRNDMNKFIKKNNVYNIDAVGMIMTDIETVSYRQVKDVDVSIISKYFGGKGHRGAGSNLQENEKFKMVINSI